MKYFELTTAVICIITFITIAAGYIASNVLDEPQSVSTSIMEDVAETSVEVATA
jgi:hypothetical protein